MTNNWQNNVLTIHNSDLGKFKECEVLFNEAFINGMRPSANKYTVFGNTIHTLLENFYDHFSLAKMLNEFPTLFESYLLKYNVTITLKEKINFLTEAREMLTNFYNLESSRGRLKFVKDREIQFNFPYKKIKDVDVILGGTIDKISDNSVWDYKTNRRKYTIDPSDSQMVIYSLAYKNMNGILPEKGVFVFVKNGSEYVFPMNDYSFQNLDDKLNKVVDFLVSKRDPIPNLESCGRCGLRQTCKHYKPVMKPRAKVGRLYINTMRDRLENSIL